MGRTTFTNITPLPASLTRETVVDFLHDHLEMIDLNPLIIDRHTIPPPPHAPPEEHRCIWYQLTDRISYLPGVSGKVSYTCAFNDLPEGLQTHCFAAMGLEIRDRWSVGGSLPGEPPEVVELGLNAPMSGLYLREDVDLRCNSIMMAFVKKTLKKAHGTLVDKISEKAHLKSVNQSRLSMPNSNNSSAFFPSQSRTSSPLTPSLGSDNLAVSPIGPLLPPSPGPRGHIRSHSTPPTKHLSHPQEGTYQTYQLTDGPSPQRAHTLDQAYQPDQQPQFHHSDQAYQSYHSVSSQQQHQTASPANGYTPGSEHLGVPSLNVPSLSVGELDVSGTDPDDSPDQGGLHYSGTVYRGNSKPQDYTDFSDMNPFEKVDPTLDQQRASGPDPLYPAPLQVALQDRRVKPAELE
ncbi:hypothetical protein B0T10DRAFT_225233 [Thelonectria olida]|uniref:DUF7053 domain-containing protein n=1 Tax=Thelonectria olida TaxID=1576542 RepID=A0A9P8WCW1_9HYPO|nr:hypothetical protein B0T10DRAFT_225233 [Thelonectria olida]